MPRIKMANRNVHSTKKGEVCHKGGGGGGGLGSGYNFFFLCDRVLLVQLLDCST